MGNNKKAIIQTLLYSDIFDFPLTQDEISVFLISSHPVEKKVIVQELKKLNTNVEEKDGYWFLNGRSHLARMRKKREKYAKEKMEKARHIAGLLSIIPTIQLIGVSGGLSMANIEEADDIDFFIITKKNTLWSTRFFALILLKSMGLLRTKSNKNVVNKACLNMFVDELSLEFSRDRQEVYTAHEIAQMVPLFERNETYNQFIKENKWVKKFLANFYSKTKQNYTQKNEEFSVIPRLTPRSSAFEVLVKKAQLYYMRQYRTTEEVSDNLLAFHPNDYRKIVIKEYNKRLRYAKI